MVTLFVTGLEFYGYHGVPEEEQKIGHRYVVDLELNVKSSAEYTDDVADTIDYAAAASAVIEIASETQFRTVERLAQAIGESLIARFHRLESVSVRLAKRLPPAPFIVEELGVELEVRR